MINHALFQLLQEDLINLTMSNTELLTHAVEEPELDLTERDDVRSAIINEIFATTPDPQFIEVVFKQLVSKAAELNIIELP